MKHMKITGSVGQVQPHLILKSTDPKRKDGARQGRAWENSVGLKEPLLCDGCERKLSVYEAYARKLLYGTTPQPIKKLKLGTTIVSVGANISPLLDMRMVTGLDYRLLKLYQLSLIWRASVATGIFFRNVEIGPKHEAKMRELLVHENPGDDDCYCCPMVDLQYNGGGCEDFTHEPERDRDEECGQRIYKMILGGYMYVFHITNEPAPTFIRPLAVNKNGEMLLLTTDAKEILNAWAKALGAAGKL